MSEIHEINRFGGTPQKNSGRGWKEKGDAIKGPFVVDVKEYEKGFKVTPQNWAKISSDAHRSKRVPAFMLALGDTEPKVRVWVISDVMFKEMLDAWEEKYGE